MARVTVELRHLLQTDFELFDFDYEFDDKQFAKELEQAVIDHYYFSEIGQPTPDKFKHVFKSRWLSMIGYYNQLHNTTLLKYNPLINYRMNEALEELRQSSNQTEQNDQITTTGNIQSESDEKTSDYPQQPIGGDYLSGASESNTRSNSKDNTESESRSSQDTTDNRNYEKTIEGLTGITYQELIQKERENLIRIKQMVIEELKPCFLLTYS